MLVVPPPLLVVPPPLLAVPPPLLAVPPPLLVVPPPLLTGLRSIAAAAAFTAFEAAGATTIFITPPAPVETVTLGDAPASGAILILIGGAEKTVPLEPVVPPPLGVAAEPLLGELTWAWFGSCQATDSRGARLRARIKVLIFNMVII